ncbi:DUF1801 domain-containing protein [Leifsonia sp. NPDC058230]|uniref:DUF1801 domain-containing protein n=1 Tax=Leifsonia sp. NPDC058230 TaxID=3346391 RepID=UPI0036DCE09E
MSYAEDPRVDDYLAGLPDWQRELFGELRELIHEADPDIQETIKRSVQPYFVLDGNVCAFLAAKDHINLFVYDGAIVPDPAGLITAGSGNQTARTIGFERGDAIDRPALLAFLRRIVANNRAGGWRKLKESAQAGRGGDSDDHRT